VGGIAGNCRRDALAMHWNDFARTMNPVVGRFAE
jgi:hypothetical protein